MTFVSRMPALTVLTLLTALMVLAMLTALMVLAMMVTMMTPRMRCLTRSALSLGYSLADVTGIGMTAITMSERVIRMRIRMVMTPYTVVHVMIPVVHVMTVAEGTGVVVMMIGVAVMPIPVMCPAVMRVPPTRPVVPVPGAVPSVPCIRPEPVIDNRSVHIYRFDDIVLSIDIFVADYLYRHLIFLIFLHVYRGYVLIDILSQYSLENNQMFVAFAGFYYA